MVTCGVFQIGRSIDDRMFSLYLPPLPWRRDGWIALGKAHGTRWTRGVSGANMIGRIVIRYDRDGGLIFCLVCCHRSRCGRDVPRYDIFRLR